MLTTSLSAKNGEDVCRIKENPVDPFFLSLRRLKFLLNISQPLTKKH